MKKFVIILLLCLCCALPAAAELDDMEDLDYWYEQLSILSEDVGCRPSGSDGEAAAVEYLRNVFAGLGFSAGDGTLNEYAVPEVQGVNLEAVIPAENENPAIIMIGAHYDSAPPVTGPDGNAYGVPGTRDNASGVAAMLTFAREFSFLPPFANTELRFVAFAAEEIGHLGSMAYVDGLSQDERERTIAMFNIDLITLDAWQDDQAFSCDTLGMRTPDGYVDGTEAAPAINRVARAVTAAMAELDYFDPADSGYTHCVPRHMGSSDHASFHAAGIDSANLCFRGNMEEGGSWHPYMHTPDDSLGDLDIYRTYEALHIVYTAIEHLAQDAAYGD